MNQNNQHRETFPESQSKALTKIPAMGIVKPQATPQEVSEALRLYRELRNSCFDKEDVIMITAFGTVTKDPTQAVARHVKKSGWRKIALAFNFDWVVAEPVLTLSEDKWGKFFVYTSTAIVTAPNGRRVYATGACSSRNPFFSKKKGAEFPPSPEDIAMMAQTVALNRAISDMVGSGEVSAEEYYALDHTGPEGKKKEAHYRSPKDQKQTSPTPDEPGKEPAPLERASGINSEYLGRVLEAVKNARDLGMSEEAYNRTWDALAINPTQEKIDKAVAYLRNKYPQAARSL